MVTRRLICALVMAVALLVAMTPMGNAADPADPTYSVTFAARRCTSYDQIMGNRAENNLQESLRDLGKASVYSTGEPVDPSIEEPNHPDCTPLTGWQFQFGRNGDGPSVDNLSTVLDPGRITPPTAQSVPLLDSTGAPTGQTLPGAVTVNLTADDLDAAQDRQLWIQGGTADDPLLYGMPVNDARRLGFGTVRCAVDNYNGDNVEWLGFPNSYRHVFCYYYAVDPAPPDGTIVVRKELAAGSDTATFRFQGNVSYTHNGTFDLTVNQGQPAETSFVRAAGDTWDFTELTDPVYELSGPPTCTSTNGQSRFTITGARVEVALGSEDRAVCTYVNRRRPTGPLALFKATTGAVGAFDFQIHRPDDSERTETVTTRTQDTPVLVAAAPNGPNGRWTVAETLPPDVGGSWDLVRFQCNGEDVPFTTTDTTGEATFDIAVGEERSCTAVNAFTPAGELRIVKSTRGGTGTFTYVVRDLDAAGGGAEIGDVVATTTTPGEPVLATGDDLTGLPVSVTADGTEHPGRRYEVQELSPPASAAGTWAVTSASCGALRSSGSVVVTLRPDAPSGTCRFVNTFVRSANVTLTKQVSGDPAGRSGDVTIDLVCTGQPAVTLTAPAGQNGPFALPEPYNIQFTQPDATRTCEARETATGVAPGATVETTIQLTLNGEAQPVIAGDRVAFTTRPGDEVQLAVSDRYSLPPSPSPTPSPSSSPTPTPSSSPTPTDSSSPSPSANTPTDSSTTPTGGSAGSLADTGGAVGLLPLAASGLLLSAIGATLTRRRHRSS